MSNMDPKYSPLFTPWKIRDVEIKNRIVLCPMGGTSLFGWMELTGNHFDKEAAKFFLEKANNNVGLIITGIAPIKSTYWGQWLYENEKMFVELKEFMNEIHKTGAKLFIQLTAGMGRSWAITSPLVPLAKSKVIPCECFNFCSCVPTKPLSKMWKVCGLPLIVKVSISKFSNPL